MQATFETLVNQKYSGEDTRSAIENAVEDVWTVGLVDGEPVRREGEHSAASPSFREHQKEAIIDIIHKLYVEDKDVVTISAPTGAGKSLILHAVMLTVKNVLRRRSFFTTPLNALIDQVDNDEFMADDVVTIKGKNNYRCKHPEDRGAEVGSAICQRQDNFECKYKDSFHTNGGCPYYGRKKAALKSAEAVTNMSYLMANSMIPESVDSKFDPRELLVVDECQKIEDFALAYIGFTVSKRTVPYVFDDIPKPTEQAAEDVDKMAAWLRGDVLRIVSQELSKLEAASTLSEPEVKRRDRLQEFRRKVQNFLADFEEHHWVSEMESDGKDWKIKFNPIFIGRFLEQFLWSQGEKVVLSSATIPKGDFLEEVGLDEKEVGRVSIPSTFPVERRPVYTREAVGKMTMGERDETIPKMVDKIEKMADYYEGKRGFIHCNSYGIAKKIYDQLSPSVRRKTRLQDSDEREASLDAWLNHSPEEEQIFLSVAMSEGISLDGDKARWQVIAKASYPYLGDKRVNYRVNELNDWNWYSQGAAIDLQQAVGRGMRSKDDWCHAFILDTSAVQLIERNEHLFEDWFLESIDVESHN